MKIQHLDHLFDLQATGHGLLLPAEPLIGVGLGTCGIGNGADELLKAIQAAFAAKGVPARIRPVGCFGFCAEEPLVNFRLPGKPLVILHRVKPACRGPMNTNARPHNRPGTEPI